MSETNSEYSHLLDDLQDYLTGGYRRKHEAKLAVKQNPSGLQEIAAEVSACRRCRLADTRTNTVPGMGVLNPLVLIVGEGPGADEDREGLPFVGRAGKYLDRWLDAVHLSRTTDCYITNVVKCRPPENRDPTDGETSACLPFLNRQIDLLKPKALLTVGRIAIQVLLNSNRGIGALRGETYVYHGIPLIPTYHPSGVLRNPDYRRAVWEDLRRLRQLVDSA